MFQPDKNLIREFAELAVLVGTNVQKGQPILINTPPEAYELAKECARVAYEHGSSRVYINYGDEDLARMNYEYMTTEDLCEIPDWQISRQQYLIDKKFCMLHIIAEDPDLLNGIDPEKIKAASLARMKTMKKFQYYTMNNIGQWSIIAYPNLAWAHKMFPEVEDDDEAIRKLWDAILMTSRVELGKTVSNWDVHNAEIKNHCDKMNEYGFKSLHFTNSLGTDLTVGLIKDHIWGGGSEEALGDFKCEFHPNIPTEEVFTMPDRYHIDGKVYSTKPLSYNGKIIPAFNLTFKDGVVVDYAAEENIEVLKTILDTDEGAKSLGEVALISYDSPISNSGLLFYNTLFDENASCHLALGACYPTTVKGGADMSEEELYELGGNNSMEHVDFMFGSADLTVTGLTYDGEEIVVFKEGNFAF